MRSNGKKIRFGVLSTARIGVKKVIPAMQKGEHTEVVAHRFAFGRERA